MRVRFQADADLNQIIVKATLRLEPSIDFQTAQAAGLAGLSDAVVLQLAADQGRILISHDRRTMPAHFGRFIATTTSPWRAHRGAARTHCTACRRSLADLGSQ